MADNRRFTDAAALPRDGCDCDGTRIGTPIDYGNQFEHDESKGHDAPIGMDPNSAGGSKVFPEWWTRSGKK